MRPVGSADTAEEYLDFGSRQARDSPCFQAWALGVAGDPEVLARLAELPPPKRQPNLVFAAARWHGARPGPYPSLRAVLLEDWDRVRTTVLERATQTNEVGRCATLLPVLAALPEPLALLELGCSAGLCLLPDRYSYRWADRAGRVHALDPATGGPSSVVLHCSVHGDPPLPERMPEVVWRGGLDLNPLDVRDGDAMAWLETLVWPEHEDRRTNLAAAVALARRDPPALVRGDVLRDLPELVAQVPTEATLVVFHSAVAAYLPERDRERLAAVVGGSRGHWLSNEGRTVLPQVSPPEGSAPGRGEEPAAFVLALDGRPLAWTHGHGRALWWLPGELSDRGRRRGRAPAAD
jgi:hypothetical protein